MAHSFSPKKIQKRPKTLQKGKSEIRKKYENPPENTPPPKKNTKFLLTWKRERDRRVKEFRKRPRSSENVRERPRVHERPSVLSV